MTSSPVTRFLLIMKHSFSHIKTTNTPLKNTTNMEKELYKKRSLSTCTKTSFNLLCNNFATIFKKSWLPSLALSMASAIIVMMQAYFSQVTPSLTSFALQMLAMFIVSILLGSWMQSSYICLLNEDKQKNVFKKCCNINLWAWAYIIVTYLIVMIILVLCTFGFNSIKATAAYAAYITSGVGLVLCILVILSTLPFIYPIIHYLIDKDAKLKKIWKSDYRTGFRYIGALFAACLICFLIVAILLGIMSVPTIILSMANIANYNSVLVGDPSALPSTMPAIWGLSTLITTFIASYIGIWVFLLFYYLYGSLATREKERNNSSK